MLGEFHPLIAQWFKTNLGEPTEPQRRGWPEIAAGRHTLIAAPTGSGKTLTAFLCCIDRLVRQSDEGTLDDGVQVVYVSPLKALSNDIHRNLETPLAQICQLAEQTGAAPPQVRAGVRTGDTSSSERQKMLRRPPQILVTTPESLYLLLTSEKGRESLRGVGTVIVDEIHALARDKRGSHLALSLERLEALTEQPLQRIGLSATVRPIDDIARFLVGNGNIDESGKVNCSIVDIGHVRKLDLSIEVPASELSAVCSNEQWDESYGRMVDLIQSHRSTLVFVNTRRLAERVAHRLSELLGEDAVASHHGSLSKQIRLSAEQRLKDGKLKAIVATASLEMGIDIGFIDLVCQIGSPRSIATFLQRVGRSGHSLGVVPKGRLFPLTRDELIECLALIRAVKQQKLDAIEIPVAPLDILAQQIVASVAAEESSESELFDRFRRAWPYRDLSRKEFDEIVTMLSDGIAPTTKRGAYLHRDEINGRLRARRGARIAALTSGGAIPETAEYRVVTEDEGTMVGTVDEDFAVESLAGDVFLLGNTSWRVRYVRQGQIVVSDAEGAPPSIPFWFGEAPGRTVELSAEISQLRSDIAEQSCHSERSEESRAGSKDVILRFTQDDRSTQDNSTGDPLIDWLVENCGATPWAASQAVHYVQVQQEALGVVPTKDDIIFERFFDDSGGMQLVIHAPLGARINRAWGLAMRKRFCRSFDFELQAAATDNGVLLSVGPQHSFAIEDLFGMLGPHNARPIVEQALLASPIFQTRWRWNVTRALGVLRMQGGKKVPPHLQRFRSDDLLSAVFPQSTGCLENHHGDVELPDHPLVRQTVRDGLYEAMDLERWTQMLEAVRAGDVRFIPFDTREPSPFCEEILNANPYAFLDDAPLEDRRTRAVAGRRGLSSEDMRDLTKLDPDAIDQVTAEAWPMVRDADELHDALKSLVAVRENELDDWKQWLAKLVAANRAVCVVRPNEPSLHAAAESLPLLQAIYSEATAELQIRLPERLQRKWESSDAIVELLRGRMQHTGPTTADELATHLGLESSLVEAGLIALEGQGVVLRGQFAERSLEIPNPKSQISNPPDLQFIDRRLLARIHRLTLSGLRDRIKPVEPADFIRYLVRYHRLDGDQPRGGPAGLRDVVGMLQGFEASAGAWESQLIQARVRGYDSAWLDNLFLSGELVWGRLRPPRRGEDEAPSMAMLTRTAPISMALRDDIPALLSGDRTPYDGALRAGAAAAFESLQDRGALFFAQLQSLTDLLPSQLEESLRELAALGLITSDSFAAVRAIIDKRKASGRRRRKPKTTAAGAAGRWSLFPGELPTVERQDHLERWCEQLLLRYGVLFRELLIRESAAPPWHELVRVLRRKELRGQIRGGRFVSGVGGEQYATDEAVGMLRDARENRNVDDWVAVSAADPLNLAGIVLPGPRVPSLHTGALILRDGRCIAAKTGNRIEFFEEVQPAEQFEMTRALHRGRRTTARKHLKQEADDSARKVHAETRQLF
jgi:ATP-dependent Lhr-like helicase